MSYLVPQNFKYPTTRYSGSKRRLLPWLWQHIEKIDFSTALDVFGGTASVSLLFKLQGKKVHYNDLLLSNQIIGRALIENSDVRVSDEELLEVFETDDGYYPDFIQSEFENIYFTKEENIFLDRIIANIGRLIRNPYKRSIIMACLFQACLSKRPYNLFHRANLYMRLADVERSFGNKKTWETPFPTLIKKYVKQYNQAIFSNDRENRVIGGENALTAPNGVDLVYLDPPYLSQEESSGTNYLEFYHFLEGLADYDNWNSRIDRGKKHKPIVDLEEIQEFADKKRIYSSFERLLTRYQKNIIVLSYRNAGLPKKEEILDILIGLGKKVEVFEQVHKYALSVESDKELLFIAR